MLSLPATLGRYPVGISTFVAPVRPPRQVGSLKLRKPGNASDVRLVSAFYLEEVAFTVYYPADIRKKPLRKGVDWVIRPLHHSLHGFATYLGIRSWLLWPLIYLFGALIKIPAYENAPPLSPLSGETSLEQWPLVIYSHGLGGSRTTYSQYCSALAASGKVVLAVEHRDGTAPMCVSRLPQNKSTPRITYYYKDTHISWEENGELTKPPLRGEQLALRRHEVYTTYSTFCRLIQNDPTLEIEHIDGSTVDKSMWSQVLESPAKPLVQITKGVILAGHSFGGCTVLSVLSTVQAEHNPIPVSKAVLLDPWIDPLSYPSPVLAKGEHVESVLLGSEPLANGDDDPNRDPTHPRILVINSETFTLWKDHFERLCEIIAKWEPNAKSILTLVGSVHVSFSDFSVLPIIRRSPAKLLLNTICKLSNDFLDERLDDSLKEIPSSTEMHEKVIGVKKDGKPKRKLVGNFGEVIIH